MIFPRPFAIDIFDSGTLGRAVIRAETYLTPSDSFGFQTNDASDTPMITFEPDSDDTQSEAFNLVGRSFDFSGTQNYVWRMGHNMNPAGAPVNSSRPMMGDEYEQFYRSGSFRSAERHIGVFQAPGRAVQRPITIFLDSVEAAPSINGNNLGINIEQLYVNDGLSATRRLTVDGTSGVLVTDVPLAVSHTSTSKDALTLNLPTSTTGKYLSFSYNAVEFDSMNKFGELYLTGSGQAGAGVRSALLTVKGRSQTTHVVQFEQSDSTPNFQIASDGSYIIYRTVTHYMRTSNGLYLQNTSNVTQFSVQANGQLWTNQRVAATTLGSVTGKIEVFNTSGVSQGFLPLYGSIT